MFFPKLFAILSVSQKQSFISIRLKCWKKHEKTLFYAVPSKKNKNIVSRLVLVVRYKLGGVEKVSKSGEHPFEALQIGAFKTQALKEQAPRGSWARGFGDEWNDGVFWTTTRFGFFWPLEVISGVITLLTTGWGPLCRILLIWGWSSIHTGIPVYLVKGYLS